MTTFTERPSANVDVANIARIYDYYLGGLYNFEVDRQKAERIRSVLPSVELLARANRDWLRRSVRFLLAQGIDQFVDLASGLPTMNNTHEVAHARNPRARVVYVDCEPSAVLHGEDILADEPLVAMIEADGREPEQVWSHPRVRELIDLSRPVGLIMGGLLVFVDDKDDPAALLAAYRDACAPGSYLSVSHLSDDQADAETRTQVARMSDAYLAGVGQRLYVRDREAIAAWFEGMELVEPGLTLMADWRPDPGLDVDAQTPSRVLGYGATARVR
ncbi:SAM-dependent methyltransferase [Kitasatospora sp. NPDC057015]|uniref:SAM-dependent methyltransferase n=1 Tax=Kitasatospora sp. NPDC057015 TaxID=3346001 RepID=UPI0036358E7F